MGMYNVIDIEINCPKCGGEIDEWQTKDLVIDTIYRVDNLLSHYKLNSRMDAEIHSYCDKCKERISFDVKKGKITHAKF